MNIITLYIVTLVNTTFNLIIIPKRNRLGYIGKNIDIGFLKSF